ncbi:MAG: hybrid sensor histidine kinase/response regulator [Candidatus Rokuibacteriota bacterium]
MPELGGLLSASGKRYRAYVATASGVALLYFLAGKAGLQFAFLHASATPVWPPAGIALAVLLVLGRRLWPAIFAGAFLVNVTIDDSPATAFGIAIGNTLEGVLGAYLVERLARGRDAFERARDIFAFVFLAGLVSTTVSATVGVTTLALAGSAAWTAYAAIWLTWWLGDAAGVIVVAPLLLLWSRNRNVGELRRRPLEASLLLLAIILVGAAVFGGASPPGTLNYPVAFLCLPGLLWAAFRFGSREAATVIVVLAGIAVAGTLRGFGPFAVDSPNESLLFLQAFLGTAAVTVLPVAALVWEGKRAEAAMRVLGETARSITSSLDLDTVLQRIAEGATGLCRSDTAAIFLRDGDSETMSPRYRVGPWPEAYKTLRIRPGEGLGGHVMQAGRPLRTAHYPSDARVPVAYRALAEQTETVALMVVPILIEGGVAGLLYISNRTARAFTDEDEAVCVGLAEQAAIAIQNARLFAEQHAARAEAEAASRAKDEFLAMLGHELRNPLGAIGNAALVLQRAGGDERQAIEARAVIERQVRHLSRLVDDLLDVARVMTGKILLQQEAVDLSEIVRRSVTGVTGTERLASHGLCLDLAPAAVCVDQTRMEQVVANLLTNALKYTPPGGEIRIGVRDEGATAVLTVSDTGVGIPGDLLPHVFELFVQEERSLDRAQGGLGIGLTLVRRLVELHGGSVTAASEGPGTGSTFTVRLPTTTLSAPPARSVPGAGAAPRRVLIVEDNDDSREMLREFLRFEGHDVHEAADGAAAVEQALRLAPDVTLVDVGLPVIDGYEVARRIRRDPAGAHLYLVALTGYGRAEDRERALAAGFDVHLVKPVDPPRLQRLLASPGRSRT